MSPIIESRPRLAEGIHFIKMTTSCIPPHRWLSLFCFAALLSSFRDGTRGAWSGRALMRVKTKKLPQKRLGRSINQASLPVAWGNTNPRQWPVSSSHEAERFKIATCWCLFSSPPLSSIFLVHKLHYNAVFLSTSYTYNLVHSEDDPHECLISSTSFCPPLSPILSQLIMMVRQIHSSLTRP